MKQKGIALVISLIFVVIMTLLALSMFSGLSTDETVSGNHREKSRSREAAQAALNNAEYWLVQPGNTFTGDWVGGASAVSCAGTQAAPTVCSYALTNPSSTTPAPAINLADPSTWTAYYAPSLTGMTVNASGGVNTYAAAPKYYIQFLGTTSNNPPTAMYQVTAGAWGGNANAVTVLQAVYQVTALSRDIGQQ
jgi:type IV pilus assembly protein PilX